MESKTPKPPKKKKKTYTMINYFDKNNLLKEMNPNKAEVKNKKSGKIFINYEWHPSLFHMKVD